MQHQWQWVRETETDNVFQCGKCLEEIGFNKPGIGEPSATTKVPDFIDQYASSPECPGAASESDHLAALAKLTLSLKSPTLAVADGTLTQQEADMLVGLTASAAVASATVKK